MADMSKGVIEKNKLVKFEGLRLYTIDGINFAPKTMLKSGVKSVKKADENSRGMDALMVKITYISRKFSWVVIYRKYSSFFIHIITTLEKSITPMIQNMVHINIIVHI